MAPVKQASSGKWYVTVNGRMVEALAEHESGGDQVSRPPVVLNALLALITLSLFYC